MKRFYTSTLILAAALFMFSSCMKKELKDLHLTKTENIILKQGDSYVYVLPSNESDEPFTIKSDAAHAVVSSVYLDSQSGNYVYKYTPEAGYTGNDRVVIENKVEKNGNCHCNNDDDYDGHAETTYTITLNFTIKANKKPLAYRTVICPSF